MDADADPDSAIFGIDLQDTNKKLILKKFYCLLLFEGKFSSFFKVTKQKESRFFLLFLIDERRIQIRIHTSD
jgi:hypothetical protein